MHKINDRTYSVDFVNSLPIVSTKIKCTGLPYYVEVRWLTIAPAIAYTMRSYYFYKLVEFFQKNLLFSDQAVRVMYCNYQYYWSLFVASHDYSFYYKLIKLTLKKFNNITEVPFYTQSVNNNLLGPNHFLVDNELSGSSPEKNLGRQFHRIRWAYTKTQYVEPFPYSRPLELGGEGVLTKVLDFGKNTYTIHFLRVQRRYNKRRYSKVRAISRPSFFAGISLSSILVANFWNASIKMVDWNTALPVVIDVNIALTVILLYCLFRVLRIVDVTVLVRKRGKIKIINSLNRLLTTKVIKYILS